MTREEIIAEYEAGKRDFRSAYLKGAKLRGC